MVERYEIRLRGRLEARWAAWFGGAQIWQDDGVTVICAALPDQAALYGLIGKVRDLGLPLVAITHVDAGRLGGQDTATNPNSTSHEETDR